MTTGQKAKFRTLEVKRVMAKEAIGFNISWNLNILSGPLFTITCGNCSYTFRKRLIVKDYPEVICPVCGSINIISLITGRFGDI